MDKNQKKKKKNKEKKSKEKKPLGKSVYLHLKTRDVLCYCAFNYLSSSTILIALIRICKTCILMMNTDDEASDD